MVKCKHLLLYSIQLVSDSRKITGVMMFYADVRLVYLRPRGCYVHITLDPLYVRKQKHSNQWFSILTAYNFLQSFLKNTYAWLFILIPDSEEDLYFSFKGKNPLQVILTCNFNNKNTELMKLKWGKQIPVVVFLK